MAKTLSVKEKIKRLEAIQDMIENCNRVIENREEWAQRSLDACTDEEGNVDESKYEYSSYLDYQLEIAAYKDLLEDLNDLA